SAPYLPPSLGPAPPRFPFPWAVPAGHLSVHPGFPPFSPPPTSCVASWLILPCIGRRSLGRAPTSCTLIRSQCRLRPAVLVCALAELILLVFCSWRLSSSS
ncbi:hypothetical protein B0H13DRAFT_2651809, partial [Mycena leptocephala]